MNNGASQLALTLAFVFAIGAQSPQDAQSVLRTMAQRQAARWDTVQNYTVEQHMEGAPMAVPLYFERSEVDGLETFRQVPIAEWMEEGTGGDQMTAEGYEMYAAGLEMIGDAHAAEGSPMAPVIKDMTDDMAGFMRMNAEAKRSGEAYADEIEDAANVGAMVAFAERARLVGSEEVDGREAFLLEADDLSDIALGDTGGSGTFSVRTMRMWIDAAEYVSLRLMMEGEYEADGERTPVTFDVIQSDYEQFGSLYEPTRRVTRISGLMEAMATDPKRREELAELRVEAAKAREELAEIEARMPEIEREMEDVPAAARDMALKQIKGQIESGKRRLDQLAGGGAIEAVMEMRVIAINEGPPVDWTPTPAPTP